MALKAGLLEDFNDSMAAKIETEFETLWFNVYNTDLPDERKNERRILFVAIARGILSYLNEHETDIEIGDYEIDGFVHNHDVDLNVIL
jgi:hypothetical protein